jgi:hypothetical protein
MTSRLRPESRCKVLLAGVSALILEQRLPHASRLTPRPHGTSLSPIAAQRTESGSDRATVARPRQCILDRGRIRVHSVGILLRRCRVVRAMLVQTARRG